MRNPPIKHNITFGHEYIEYNNINSFAEILRSDLKLSCNAPGLS